MITVYRTYSKRPTMGGQSSEGYGRTGIRLLEQTVGWSIYFCIQVCQCLVHSEQLAHTFRPNSICVVGSFINFARLALTSWNGKLSVVCSDAGRMRETALDVGAITSLSVLDYVEFSVNTRSLLETRGE